MSKTPLTRREWRERERALAEVAAADQVYLAPTGPSLGLPDDSVGSEFTATSISFPEPVATPAVFPSRRALRLATQKAAAEAAEEFESDGLEIESVVADPTFVTRAAANESDRVPSVPDEVSVSEPSGADGSESIISGLEKPIIVVHREAAVVEPTVVEPTVVEPTVVEPTDVPADRAPATRREARSIRPAVEVTRAAAKRPPVARAASRPPAKPAARAARGRTRRILAKGFPLVVLTFVAGLMISTTTPAAALLSQADVSARSSAQAVAVKTTPREDPQSYTAASGDTLTVARDGYQTSSVERIAQESGIRMEATFTNNPNGTVQWPFPVGVHIGDQFGYRNCFGCSSNHRGQDFNPGDGAPIQSIADGVVRVAENGGGSLGVYMIIDHQIDGRLVSSVYAHMQYDSMNYVTGDTVKVGDVIGATGTTGMSTGPHLHFEIRLDGVLNVDPLEWLYNNTD